MIGVVHTRNQQGYTLIELMTVAAIVGIMTAIAVPSFLAFQAHRSLTIAADELASDLRLARQYAISRSARHRILFDAGAEQYQIERCTCPGTLVGEARDLSRTDFGRKTVDLVSVKDSTGVALATPAIEFNTNGIVVSPGANFPVTITLQRPGSTEQKVVTVNIAGMVKVQDPA
ncbi:MAG: GspH/FimT family pseudopilin [Nitrospirota bacterium]